MARNDGTNLENLIQKLFPGASKTKRSGAAWGDGDLKVSTGELGEDLSIESKDQDRVSLDSWWSQTRRQALRFGRVPVLVIRRPPATLDRARATNDEILAVIPFRYLHALHEKINDLERTLESVTKKE